MERVIIETDAATVAKTLNSTDLDRSDVGVLIKECMP